MFNKMLNGAWEEGRGAGIAMGGNLLARFCYCKLHLESSGLKLLQIICTSKNPYFLILKFLYLKEPCRYKFKWPYILTKRDMPDSQRYSLKCNRKRPFFRLEKFLILIIIVLILMQGISKSLLQKSHKWK